jgi:hypothetical protein
MRLHNPFGDGEPKTGPVSAVSLRRIGFDEFVEDLRGQRRDD